MVSITFAFAKAKVTFLMVTIVTSEQKETEVKTEGRREKYKGKDTKRQNLKAKILQN
jgi:hypothetical protein